MRLARAWNPGDNPQLAAGARRVFVRHTLIGCESVRRRGRDRADAIARHPAVSRLEIVMRILHGLRGVAFVAGGLVPERDAWAMTASSVAWCSVLSSTRSTTMA